MDNYTPPPLRVQYLHNLSRIHMYWIFVRFPSFTYLFNHVFMPIWTQWLFFFNFLVNNPILLRFVAQIVPALAPAGASSRGSCVPLTCPHHRVFLFSNFLISGTTRYSRVIFFMPRSCNQPYSQEFWVLFLWE